MYQHVSACFSMCQLIYHHSRAFACQPPSLGTVPLSVRCSTCTAMHHAERQIGLQYSTCLKPSPQAYHHCRSQAQRHQTEGLPLLRFELPALMPAMCANRCAIKSGGSQCTVQQKWPPSRSIVVLQQMRGNLAGYPVAQHVPSLDAGLDTCSIEITP